MDSKGKEEDLEVDNILAMVGYRPDTSITEELQVGYQKSTSTYVGVSTFNIRFTTVTQQRVQ